MHGRMNNGAKGPARGGLGWVAAEENDNTYTAKHT